MDFSRHNYSRNKKRMEIISAFNNKGGVGKTTFVCNFASYLAKIKNKRVLIIDADPQCNATTYILKEEKVIDLYTKTKGTLNDITLPVRRGKGYYIDEYPIVKTNEFGVHLIPGDPKLSLFEDFLATDWISSKSGDGRGLQTTLLFKNLIADLRNDYDLIFFDLGPSLGALNRSILISCTYFLIPMSSDIFSLRALENISISISTWKNDLNEGLRKYNENEGEEYTFPISPYWNISLAGYITQQYTSKTEGGRKRPVKAYDRIISKIPSSIVENLGSLFVSANDLYDPKLGEIPNLHSLVPLSQVANVPIFSLKAKHGVVGAHFYKINEYSEMLEKVSLKFFKNLNIQ